MLEFSGSFLGRLRVHWPLAPSPYFNYSYITPPGPWPLAPGPWHYSHTPPSDPWPLAPGPWPLAPGPQPLLTSPPPYPLAPGPWPQGPPHPTSKNTTIILSSPSFKTKNHTNIPLGPFPLRPLQNKGKLKHVGLEVTSQGFLICT